MVGQKRLDDTAQAGENPLYVVDGGVPSKSSTRMHLMQMLSSASGTVDLLSN